MKAFNTQLSIYSQDKQLRSDAKYHRAMVSTGNNLFGTSEFDNIALSEILIKDYRIFDYDDDQEYKGIPTGQAYIDEDGYIIDWQTVTADDHPERLRYAATSNNILISSIRLAKSPALNFNTSNLDKYVFSNGFYIFSVKVGWDKRFVLHLLRSKRIKNFIDYSIYRGIGISAYRAEDLLKVEIRNLNAAEQKKALEKIHPFEQSIREFKSQIKAPQLVIDEIFAREFGLSPKSLYEIANSQNLNVNWSNLSFNNSNLRFSCRWNKAGLIQEALLLVSDKFVPLGKHIIRTRNGYSPECGESASKYGVLGLDAIGKDTVLKLDNLKYTDLSDHNDKAYIVRSGDFFVSRGNTTDLVALASIAELRDIEDEIIYPDLMIKIEFTDGVDKRYMAYVFNSFIGRLYFKYATKGKNQTMVKVSAKELRDFYVPLPSITAQKRIVKMIQLQMMEQDTIKSKIADLRSRIDTIIENALTQAAR